MSDSVRYVRRPGLFSAKMPDGQYAILDAERSVFFGLNEVGARIWELLESSKSAQEISDHLLEEYAVTQEQCAREVNAFIANMTDQALIERVE